MKYWNIQGQHQDLYNKYWDTLVPDSGEADTPEGEALRAITRIYYDVYNNGGCNIIESEEVYDDDGNYECDEHSISSFYEGFFDTGDVATIDADGYMRITDRSKDVIKSGGEWISSIDLENLAVGHPKVLEAAVIGVHHPKWDERPLLIVQLKPDQKASREEILQYMDGKIAKWWMPDDVQFVEAIPHTATGKILKTALRDQFKNYAFPTAAA